MKLSSVSSNMQLFNRPAITLNSHENSPQDTFYRFGSYSQNRGNEMEGDADPQRRTELQEDLKALNAELKDASGAERERLQEERQDLKQQIQQANKGVYITEQ